jgi:hypothetical protein
MSIAFTNEWDQDKTYEGGRQYEDDKNLLVRFEVRATKNEYKSKQEGRPIFEDAEYIQIIVPGSRDINTYPLDEHYKTRFRDRYNLWKQNTDIQHIEGTILSELPWLSKSQIAELNYCNVLTVEQLANLSDTNARQFMGNFQLRERAKNYLAAAAGEAPMQKLQAALEERDNRIEVLQSQVKDLVETVKELQKKRG